MLRIISEQTLDTDEELCACFIDRKKAFDPCQLDQINADPKENWDRLVQEKTDQKTVH
jgi:hypothetical protein